MGGLPQACIFVRNLHAFNIQVSRNTISKGSGAGIKLFNVKASPVDMNGVLTMPRNEQQAADVLQRCSGVPERVELLDNYIVDTVDGFGMVIDSTTC